MTPNDLQHYKVNRYPYALVPTNPKFDTSSFHSMMTCCFQDTKLLKIANAPNDLKMNLDIFNDQNYPGTLNAYTRK